MDRLWADNDESRTSDDPSLVVDVAGFEGPLDLLLHLARNQKVDLTRISVLALAEQYLGFIGKVRELRLEIAADFGLTRERVRQIQEAGLRKLKAILAETKRGFHDF